MELMGFIERNKGVVIGLAIFLCVGGIAFAAAPELFFKSEETITSVDNSAILNANLDTLNPNLKINSLRQNANGYEISYSHDTYGVANGFWQKMGVTKTISVDKNNLVNQSLGKYVALKIVDELNSNLLYLKGVQASEREKGLTEKTVTTTYSGLLGGFLSPETQVEENPSSPNNPNSDDDPIDPNTIEEEIEELLENIDDPTTPPAPPGTPPSPIGIPAPQPAPTPLPAPSPMYEETVTPPSPGFASPPPGFYYVPTPSNYVPEPDSVGDGPAGQ